MKIKKLLLTCLVASGLTVSAYADDYILATASTGGTYYPVGAPYQL